MSRGVGAALLAAAVVLSGCGAVEENVTTTSPSPETPVNPWDLPLEDRPALFDPCAEIPVEAVEEALGGPVEPDDRLHNGNPRSLISCGWKNNEAIFGVLGTWKSREEYVSDGSYAYTKIETGNRHGLRLVATSDLGANRCREVFFTSRGTAFISLDLFTGTTSFKGKDFVEPCEALSGISETILTYAPAGSF